MDLSKNGSRPTPDAGSMKHLSFKLEEALASEHPSNQNLQLIESNRRQWDVTLSARDGAVHILRFLRIWFDVPQTVFFNAVSLLDQFLAKMKVEERYLRCATLSCFYVAAERDGYNIDRNQLVTVSQSKCSEKDMLRMAEIVKQKLKTENKAESRSTAADFLLTFIDILEYRTQQWNVEKIVSRMLEREKMLTRLEVLMTDHTCAFYRPSVLALVLIQFEIEKQMAQSLPNRYCFYQEMLQFFKLISDIQGTCKLKSNSLVNCYNKVSNVLKQYDNQDRTKHSQNLLWRFSSSTYAMCNKYRNFQLLLDTIEEQNQNHSG